MSQAIPMIRMQQGMPSIRSLAEFGRSPQDTDLFRDAINLPTFFQTNLVDPNRIVKQFLNDPQATIRVFYYQYLKLCFQLQEVDYQGYIKKIEQIINNESFKFMFYEEDDAEIFNDTQFKHLIMEFFGVLGEGTVSVQQALHLYPIMDTVFIFFLRSILILTGNADSLDSYIDRESLLSFLCSYFNVEVSTHDRCVKFVETDIFVFEEDPKKVYMAFIQDQSGGAASSEEEQLYDYHREPQQVPQVQMIISQPVQPSSYSQHSSSHRGTSQINQSYIASQFVDYTQTASSQHRPTLPTDNLKYSGQISHQNSFGKIGIDPINSHPIALTKPISPQPAFQPPQKFSVSYYNQTSVYDSLSQSYSQEAQQKSRPSSITKNQPFAPYSQTPILKKYEDNNILLKKDWEPTPTKDPGFSKYNINNELKYSNEQSNNVFSKKSQQSYEQAYSYKKPTSYTPYDDKYQSKKPNSYTPYEQKYEVKVAKATYQPSKVQSQLYQQQLPANNFYQSQPGSSNHSSNSYNHNVYAKPPSNISENSSNNYKTANPNTYQTQVGKNPYNLNVSLQFTNSFTMKAMAQPFKNNVRTIRNRARDYRDSLRTFMK